MKTQVSRRAFRPVVKSFAVFVLGGFPWSRLQAQEVPPVQCGFEEPEFTPGNIHGQRGWSVQQGRAEIVGEQAHTGQRALKLFAADPFSQAKLTLAPAEPPAPVMFLDFYVIPAASDAARQEEFLDVDGARIGLFMDPAKPGEGVVHVFHGDGAGGGQWLPTAVTLPLAEGTRRTSGWVRLSLREDFARQTWDLWVDGRTAAADLGFQEADVGHTQNYIIMGDAMESVLLDDLSIQERHPLGPDADADGMVDSIERQLGLNHLFDDRDADADGDGVRNLEEALAAAVPAGEPSTLVNAAPERPAAPSISLASGFLEAAAAVELTGVPAGGKIRYTTDGSDPRRASGPRIFASAVPVTTTAVLRAVAVDARGRMSDVSTAAWVFPGDVAAQQRPEGAPDYFTDVPMNGNIATTWSAPWTLATGGVGQSTAAALPVAIKSAPVAVVVAGPSVLFDPTAGLYSRSSVKVTAPATVVYFREGAPASAAETAISISGESSRFHNVSLKHSLRLRFAGTSSVAASLAGSAADEVLRQVVLRHPTHDSWTVGAQWISSREHAKYFADGFAARWFGDAGHLTLRRQWVHVFLNATYWGVYEAIEQNDPGASGITDLLEAGSGQQVQSIFGESRTWREARARLLELASLAARGPVEESDWTSAAAPYDLDGLIDYILLNCWLSNLDWPEHNYLIARHDGRWRFLPWDAEWSLRRDNGVAVDLTQRLQSAGDGPAFVFSSLCWWPAFRVRVAARLDSLAAEGGLLHPASLVERITREAGLFRSLLPAEAARWGGALEEPGAAAMWERNVAWLQETYALQRTGIMAAQIQALLAQTAASAEAGALAAQARGDSALPALAIPFRPAVLTPDSRDRDGDGIPDDWELSHGLNPRDRADGRADADGDGLSNLTEYLLGRDTGRAESLAGTFNAEPAGVYSRPQLPRIRNGVRVNLLGRVLTPEEAQQAAADEAQQQEGAAQ